VHVSLQARRTRHYPNYSGLCCTRIYIQLQRLQAIPMTEHSEQVKPQPVAKEQ
jgi:hypothetical protein